VFRVATVSDCPIDAEPIVRAEIYALEVLIVVVDIPPPKIASPDVLRVIIERLFIIAVALDI